MVARVQASHTHDFERIYIHARLCVSAGVCMCACRCGYEPTKPKDAKDSHTLMLPLTLLAAYSAIKGNDDDDDDGVEEYTRLLGAVLVALLYRCVSCWCCWVGVPLMVFCCSLSFASAHHVRMLKIANSVLLVCVGKAAHITMLVLCLSI